MDIKEILDTIKSVKLCLMAHPDNEEGSEFADRIDDLENIEVKLGSPKSGNCLECGEPLMFASSIGYHPDCAVIAHERGNITNYIQPVCQNHEYLEVRLTTLSYQCKHCGHTDLP